MKFEVIKPLDGSPFAGICIYPEDVYDEKYLLAKVNKMKVMVGLCEFIQKHSGKGTKKPWKRRRIDIHTANHVCDSCKYYKKIKEIRG